VLILIIIAFNILMMVRGNLETTVLRARGQNYTIMPDGRISNLYKYKIVNKSNDSIPLNLKLINIKGEIELIGVQGNIMLKPEQKLEGIMMIKIDSNELHSRTNGIKIDVMNGDQKLEEINSVFMAPRHHKATDKF